MGISEKIRILMVKRGVRKEKELADLIGMSPQNLNNKLKRETFSDEELGKIAAALKATYTARQWFTLNDTGEEI
jgi:transcriptional regulator with XRE-family HTH domain